MAAVGGYSSIGGADSGNGNGAKPSNGPPSNMQERIGAIARGATVVAAGAKEAVTSAVTAPMPEVKLYTQPLNPSESLTLRARIELVVNSCRDWREFFDVRQYNLPPAAEVKLRYGSNVETFFYNYFVVAIVTLVVLSALHPLRGLQVAALVAIATLFYAVHPDPINVPLGAGREIVLADTAKHGILAGFGIIALIFGHLAPILIQTLVFGSVVLVAHGFLRDHREPAGTSDV